MSPEKDKHHRFLAAYGKVHEGFLRYCSALAFERMDVEDLIQDCLLSAYRKFDDLADPNKLQHYLIRAARNRKVDLFRSAKRKASLTQLQGERLLARGATPEQLADVHLLYRAIHQLPAKQRDAILLLRNQRLPAKGDRGAAERLRPRRQNAPTARPRPAPGITHRTRHAIAFPTRHR